MNTVRDLGSSLRQKENSKRLRGSGEKHDVMAIKSGFRRIVVFLNIYLLYITYQLNVISLSAASVADSGRTMYSQSRGHGQVC